MDVASTVTADEQGDRLFQRALLELVEGVRLCRPDELAGLANEAVARLGVSMTIYLVDHEQQALHPLPGVPVEQEGSAQIDGTMAGRAFMSVATVEAGHEGMPEHFWVPLVDGSERLGVVEVQVIKTVVDWPGLVARCERFVDVLAHIVIAKWSYGDTLVRLRRTRPMTAGGELLLSMLPPLTYTCSDMVISAVLEPAYEVGGDAFDYAVDGRVARLLVLDAMGHGLSAASTSTVALAAIRAARRNGGGLHAMATAADAALTQQFPDLRYVTGVLAELHLDSGMLRYINAGHPQPILIRGGHTVQQLGDGRRLPLGMQDNFLEVGMQSMSRGDRLLLYTDGIIEARDYAGGPFGVTRLIDLLRRTTSYGFPAPETLRRLSHNVIARQPGPPADDATLLLLQWSHQAALKAIP